LAVLGREGEDCRYLEAVNDPMSERAAAAERAALDALGCGCASPSAAYASVSGNSIKITAAYMPQGCERAGRAPVRGEICGDVGEAEKLAYELARRLARQGAEGAEGCGAGGPAGAPGPAPAPAKGKIWLVGAGPGAAGLLTVRARQVLAEADVVMYDRLVSEEILCEIPCGTRLVDAGKRAGEGHGPQEGPGPQERITAAIIAEALAGRSVVRLKGGDPFLFGRGGEELLAAREAGIPFEVVPGVSSALAVPAYAGIPVTHRGVSSAVHIMTWSLRGGARVGDGELEALAAAGGTLVALMAAGRLAELGERLVRAGFGPETPAAVIRNGATSRQSCSVTALGRLGECGGEAGAPATVVVGGVCALGGRLSWIHDRPLNGARIVVTRPEPQNSGLCEKIRAMGGEAVPFPCIKTASRRLGAGVGGAGRFAWLVFTSAAGVEFFFDSYFSAGNDIRQLAACRFAAVGEVTSKALAKRGVRSDFVPARHDGRSLGAGLAAAMGAGEGALVIGQAAGPRGLTDELDKSGVAWQELAVYEVARPGGGGHAAALVRGGRFDFVFLTSASTAEAFAEAAAGLDLGAVTAICIGAGTAERARALCMKAE
jgi:uroporphyrinogen III methyltransferase/synthase